MSDEKLLDIIWDCVKKGWVEELTLCVNVPRSSVEYLLFIASVLFGPCYCEYFWFLFLFCPKINKIVVRY